MYIVKCTLYNVLYCNYLRFACTEFRNKRRSGTTKIKVFLWSEETFEYVQKVFISAQEQFKSAHELLYRVQELFEKVDR